MMMLVGVRTGEIVFLPLSHKRSGHKSLHQIVIVLPIEVLESSGTKDCFLFGHVQLDDPWKFILGSSPHFQKRIRYGFTLDEGKMDPWENTLEL